MSQRDLQRAFRFLDFFLADHKAREVQLEPGKLVHRCLLLSMAMTYYFRLPASASSDSQQDGLRLQFCRMIAQLQPPAGRYTPNVMPWDFFEDVVADELRLYIEGAQLPPGIAANLALIENFFCIAVCMQTKTPLIIVGTPGTDWCLCIVLTVACITKIPLPFATLVALMPLPFTHVCAACVHHHAIR